MMGFATIVVIAFAAVVAIIISRFSQVSAMAKRLLEPASQHLGIASMDRAPSVLAIARDMTNALKREVDRSRLQDGTYLGGRYVVWVRRAEWTSLAGRVLAVGAEVIDAVLAETGLAPEQLEVAFKCDPDAKLSVRVVEEHLPPRTRPRGGAKAAPQAIPVEPPVAVRLALVDLQDAEVLGLSDDVPKYIGRAASCDLTLTDQTVSEHHACITARGGDAELLDLGSRNGTEVNGSKIAGAARLLPGDLLQIGSITLRVVDHDAVTPQVEPPSGRASAPIIDLTPPSVLWAEPTPAPRVTPPSSPRAALAKDPAPIRTQPMSYEDLPRPVASRTDPVVLGWDRGGVPVLFDALSDPTSAGNGHLLVYGSSGMGKTEALRAFIPQAIDRGITACVIDQAGGFGGLADTTKAQPWAGMHGNPLCPPTSEPGSEDRTKVEVVEALFTAVKSQNSHLGHRQRAKLREAVESAYAEASAAGRWPTLLDLHDHLDADLRGVIGEITGRGLFASGGPLGNVLATNTVIDVSAIPGTGTLQRMVTGLVLAAIDLRVTSLPAAHGSVRHLLVIDEANRVAGFGSVDRLLREGRSAGVAIAISSQQPQDLPDVAHAVAGTTVCLRLGAKAAAIAAGHLDPTDPSLSKQITGLAAGEAFVKVAGQRPMRVRLVQHHRDAAHLAPAPLTAGVEAGHP